MVAEGAFGDTDEFRLLVNVAEARRVGVELAPVKDLGAVGDDVLVLDPGNVIIDEERDVSVVKVSVTDWLATETVS